MHFIILFLLNLSVFNPSVCGAEYRLLETFPIVAKRPSGLAYDPVHDSLWMTEEHGGDLVEIDKKGNVSKKITLRFEDVEGLAYRSDADSFFLLEEKRRQIVEIDRTGKTLNIIPFPLRWYLWGIWHWSIKYGTEGIAYDPKGKSIFLANEKELKRVMEFKENGRVLGYFDVPQIINEISDLYYDVATDRLLVLSGDGKVVLEFTRKGKLLSSFPILALHAEAFTKDSKGYLYIVSQSTNILYVYAPEVVPASK